MALLHPKLSSAVFMRRLTSGTRARAVLPPGVGSGRSQQRPVRAAGAAKQRLYTTWSDSSLEEPSPGFDSIASALEDMAAGKFVVVLDDEDRENEGDLIIAGDKITTESMAYMVEYTSGVICVAMPGADLDRLRLPLMVDSRENNESMYTAFTVTVDLKDGTTTGISAADRAATIRAMADPAASPDDFRRPGHIFPLRYRNGGVIVRPGHTEAAVDLSRLAGCAPAGVLCEIVDKSDGSMQRTPQLRAFAAEHGLRIITIADLIRYRLRHEQLLKAAASAPLATRYGDFTAHVFRSALDGREHVALVAGGPAALAAAASGGGAIAAVHAQSSLVDVFGSLHCGRESFLDSSLDAIAAEGAGVLLYINTHSDAAAGSEGGSGSGSGSSMAAELEAYAQQQRACSANGASGSGRPSALADLRDGAAAAQMLRHLGLGRVRLLAGGEGEARRLQAFGIEVPALAGSGGSGGLNGAAAHHSSGDGLGTRPKAAV
jgi:3,4-dihydroxy 2-butanone 4-phosphate synthase/GTP cyclohydrolase II